MSGIIGHTMYAILGAKAAKEKKLPVAPLITRQAASYHCGAYLGCDVQTMPEAICVDSGLEVGYGTAPLKVSPITGGEVRPWSLKHAGKSYRPREIHQLFYGRAHLVFGWRRADREHTVPWDHLADYCAAVVNDAVALYRVNERSLAYLFGWMAHIVGDSLIKSVQPGIDLRLHGGKYTPTNRPIQDLVSFHEVGRKELKLNWQAILDGLVKTPVEAVQLHYMRIGKQQGELGADFMNAWEGGDAGLLRDVLGENRRYQAIRNPRLLKQLELRKTPKGMDCDPELTRRSLGLHYPDMVELAEKANFRHALWQMGEAVAKLFAEVVERVPDRMWR
jgi:hypothetical protein